MALLRRGGDCPHGGWAGCIHLGSCTPGCAQGAKASADITYWPEAIRAGVQLKPRCRVREITTGADGMATGAIYYDAEDVGHFQPAEMVILACNRIGTPPKPREGTKQEAVLTLLRRAEGATIAQIMDTTAWASHTCRSFLEGLKKRSIKIEALEKVRMVGPNKEGAKGSYTIHAITD